MPSQSSRAAVVVNPTKFDDVAEFRDKVCAAIAEVGWAEPLWLETTADDPGTGQAAQAASAGVDVVLAAGGDGTVTACAAGLAGTTVPLAIIPAGTGNLLALNLGLPTDLDRALAVALAGTQRQVDVGEANGRPFVAMAGIGLDANMLRSTTESAKKRYGYAAYVVAVLRHLRDRPMRITVQADGGRPKRHRATGVIVGNVGWLQGGLPLMPDAEPDDGLLDVVVLTAHGLTSWLLVALHVLLRRETAMIFRSRVCRLRITADRPHLWELDGEVIGSAGELEVAICEEKLRLMVPASGEQA